MDFDTALDELYDAAPEDFVAERSRLAKALKADGLAAEAQRLAELRKPVLAAWVLNRLVRDRRRDVDLLLHSGHRLRLAKEREAFEEARRAEREAVDRLTREAAKLLEARGSTSEAIIGQVADSLRAAAISDEGRELLARGRFTQPFEGGGFDVVSALAPSAPARRSKQGDTKKQREAKAALTEAKAQLRLAEREADAARRALDTAEAKIEAARREVESAEARLRRVSGK